MSAFDPKQMWAVSEFLRSGSPGDPENSVLHADFFASRWLIDQHASRHPPIARPRHVVGGWKQPRVADRTSRSEKSRKLQLRPNRAAPRRQLNQLPVISPARRAVLLALIEQAGRG
jgi:hypothetical protein